MTTTNTGFKVLNDGNIRCPVHSRVVPKPWIAGRVSRSLLLLHPLHRRHSSPKVGLLVFILIRSLHVICCIILGARGRSTTWVLAEAKER